MTLRFEVLDEVELLEFFGAEPVERSAEDGYWCYAVTERAGRHAPLLLQHLRALRADGW